MPTLRPLVASLTIAASLVVASLTIAPSARADSWLDPIVVPTIAGASLVGAGLLTLAVADVVSFALGTPYDDGCAAVDLIVGTLATLGGLAGVAYYALVDQGVPGIGGVCGVVAALGATEIAHAGWSFATNDPPPLAVTLAPSESGAMIGLSGWM